MSKPLVIRVAEEVDIVSQSQIPLLNVKSINKCVCDRNSITVRRKSWTLSKGQGKGHRVFHTTLTVLITQEEEERIFILQPPRPLSPQWSLPFSYWSLVTTCCQWKSVIGWVGGGRCLIGDRACRHGDIMALHRISAAGHT